MVKETEFYDRLGVQPEVGQDQLRKAYYKRAKECHPDKHPGDKAKEAEFKALSEAYQVLSDPEQRKNYDSFGKASLQGGPDVDARDLFATVFGGPEFEPFVGTMLQSSDVDEALVRKAEEAKEVYLVRRQELHELKARGALPPNEAQAAEAELKKLKDEVISTQKELEEAQRKLQHERVLKCSEVLRKRVDEYVAADAQGREAWKSRVSEEFEKLKSANMGEPMMHAIGYAYVYQTQKQLGRHGVGVHRVAGYVEDMREGFHNFSEIVGAIGTAIGTAHASYKLLKASERQEAGQEVPENERAELEKRASQKAFQLLWAVTKKDIEDTIRAVVDEVMLESSSGSSSASNQAVASNGNGRAGGDAEFYNTLPPEAITRAEAIICIGRTFLNGMSFEQFLVKDEEPSKFRQYANDVEDRIKGAGIDVDAAKRNLTEAQELAIKRAEEWGKAAGTSFNKLFGWRKS